MLPTLAARGRCCVPWCGGRGQRNESRYLLATMSVAVSCGDPYPPLPQCMISVCLLRSCYSRQGSSSSMTFRSAGWGLATARERAGGHEPGAVVGPRGSRGSRHLVDHQPGSCIPLTGPGCRGRGCRGWGCRGWGYPGCPQETPDTMHPTCHRRQEVPRICMNRLWYSRGMGRNHRGGHL